MPARRLFLSYARAERPRVDALANDLRRAGCDVFFDEQLTTGEDWWNALLGEIEGCDAFIPVLSKQYVVSTPCRLEAEYAHTLSKPLLPIMIETMDPDECAWFIAETHCLQYDHTDANSILDLVRALMLCPEAPALPDTMPARPPVPRSYAGITVQALRERLDATNDLTRQEQVLLLADLKTVMQSAEVSSSTCRELLVDFSRRPELTVTVGNEITQMLSTTPAEEKPPASDDETVVLTCGDCSTVNRVPRKARGYVCRSCEAVTEFPTCTSCNKLSRIATPKGTGGANYHCPSCNSKQTVRTAVSDSSVSVVCSCRQWNVLPASDSTRGFTCGACKKQFVFCRCPSCNDRETFAVPAGKKARIPWKSDCGKTFQISRSNAAPVGVVVPVTTLYPTGLPDD